MNFWRLIWLFPVAIALHNAEEAIWLPAWSQTCDRWPIPWAPGIFRFGAALLTFLAAFLTWMSARSGGQSMWTYLLVGYAAAALANVFVPHLWMTVVTRRLMPGTLTGVAFVTPSLTLLLVLAVRDHAVSIGPTAEYALAVAALLLASIRLLFWAGKRLQP